MRCDHKTISEAAASIEWLQFIISTHNNRFSFKFKLQKKEKFARKKYQMSHSRISHVSVYHFHLLSHNLTMSHEFLIIQEDLLLHFAHISPITICKTNYITTSKQRTKLHLVSHKDSTFILIWIYIL